MSVPLTLAEALRDAREKLIQAGIETAGLDSQLILGFVLGISREAIIGYPERTINKQDRGLFTTLIERRAAQEPLAYITGCKEFWGRAFSVTHDTLIPRPDSESLIEAVMEQIPDRNRAFTILDFGSGSGCLSLTLLAEYPQATGVAVDISAGALAMVKKNAQQLGCDRRVKFIQSDWDANIAFKADLIVSNPPYIAARDWHGLERDVTDYEPANALLAGEDGMDAYAALAPAVKRCLQQDGMAVIEAGAEQADEISLLFARAGLAHTTRYTDLAGIDRALVFHHDKGDNALPM